MWIKALKDIKAPHLDAKIGDVVEVPPRSGAAHIDRGEAVEVQNPALAAKPAAKSDADEPDTKGRKG